MNRITHFEFATTDLDKTAAFYREVFGWQVEKWAGPVDYWVITNGDTSTPGINGGLMQSAEGIHGTVNTIEVDNIDSAITQVLIHGGEIVIPKHAIASIGYQAYFKDNNGIIVGLHQNDPNAGKG